MAYVILTDRLEARVTADRQIVGAALAAGATGLDMPDPDEARERFDAALEAAPVEVNQEQAELARALGVA